MPGGVCAVLDYEVELMAEYVAEMATRLAMGTATAPVAFRKFISQILSSTRLPSTTILLGMNYLSKRINMLNLAGGQGKMSEGQMWRMLTVSLLLGSKFLDDNTFQNRSWAEVSGIPVRELNTLEYEWMGSISWNLYVNLDRSEDYNAWLKSWRDWSDNKKRQAMTSRDRLNSLVPPIETDVSRSRQNPAYSAWHQQQVAEFERYERLSSMKRNEQARQQTTYRGPEQTWASSSQHVPWPTSPLTPPDSGYGTPEYMGSAASVNSQHIDWFSQQNRAMAKPTYGRQQQYPGQTCASQNNVYQTRNQTGYPYNFYPGQNIWEHSPTNCRCQNCVSSPQHNQQPYFNMPTRYGQPVAS